MYDPQLVRRAILSHARAAHDGEISLDVAAERIRELAACAELYADPIAAAMIVLAEGFEAGDFCTVIVPELMEVVARDDRAIPNWRQSDGALIVHLEADARALQVKDLAAEVERFRPFLERKGRIPKESNDRGRRVTRS